VSINFDDGTQTPLTPDERKIPSGDKYFVRSEEMAKLCGAVVRVCFVSILSYCFPLRFTDPDRTGMGNNGLDLINCGLPGNRTWIDNTTADGVALIFQFKTYSETPEMDVFYEQQVLGLQPDLLVIGTGAWGVPAPVILNKYGVRHAQLVDQIAFFVGNMRRVYSGPMVYLGPHSNADVTPVLRRRFDGNCSGPAHSAVLTWDRNDMLVCVSPCPEAVVASSRKHAWVGLIQQHMVKAFVSLLCQ
jgi:hypothetical protein